MSKYKSTNLFRGILELSKVKITIAVAITTLTGYVLAKGKIDTGILLPVAGIFLLACGSSVLNHLQEKETDARMKRTKNRPLPSGKIKPVTAVIIALIELTVGSILLYIGPGTHALLLGLLATLWYNIIYTYLKKKTVHAVIPGSLIGAIPPLVGWIAAGGNLLDPDAIFIALFFFVWQVPHFYLLGLKYSQDYKNAGFPSMTDHYEFRKFQRMLLFWVISTAIVSNLLPVFQVTKSHITFLAIGLLSLRIIYIFIQPLQKSAENFKPGIYFMKINYYVLMIVVILLSDHYFAILF